MAVNRLMKFWDRCESITLLSRMVKDQESEMGDRKIAEQNKTEYSIPQKHEQNGGPSDQIS